MPGFALKTDRRYTLADYDTWPSAERWELINGDAYMMSPSPSRAHQDIVLELAALLRDFLRDKPCRPVIAPYDVKFDNFTVVQPDVSVWCVDGKTWEHIADDENKEKSEKPKKQGKGKPEKLRIVAEVLSPSSATYDLNEKLRLYERQGVPEYWVISPSEERILRFSIENGKDGKYAATPFNSGVFQSEALKNFTFDIENLFAISKPR